MKMQYGKVWQSMTGRLILAIASLAIIAGCGGGIDYGTTGYDVAFAQFEGPGTVSLWRLDTGFRETGSYTGVESPGRIAFSPDGRTVAMVLRRDGQYDICTMSVEGGALQWLTDDPSDDGDPSFSRDGSRIVFCSERDGHSQIYVMDSDGSGETRLTDTESSEDTWPSFSWDGTKIAFASDCESDTGDTHIFVMDANGSSVRQLTSGEQTYDAEPSFSPDGAQIVYVSASDPHGSHDIRAVRTDGTRDIALTSEWGDCHSPSFSPDGWTIMFSSDRRTLDQQVWMMRTDGSGKGRITESGGYYPSWISTR